MTTPAPRPQKVTLACLMAGVGSLVVLISFTAMLADWVPKELRQQVEDIIDEPPLSDYDLGTEQVLEWMRIGLMVGAAFAVAAIILSIYTARGHRGARLVLTVISAGTSLVFVPSGIAGLIPAAMAIACAVLLWSREASDWFNPEKAARRQAEQAAAGPPESTAPWASGPAGSGESTEAAEPTETAEPAQARPADVPFAAANPSARTPPFGTQAATRTAQSTATPPAHPAERPGRLPGTVLAAILTVTIMSALVLLGGAAVVVTYAASPEELGQEMLSQPALADSSQFQSLGWSAVSLGRGIVYVMLGLVALSVVAIATALWMLRRSNAARIVLVVLSGVTIAVSVAATLVGIPWITAAITVIVLLFRPSANAYFRPGGVRPG